MLVVVVNGLFIFFKKKKIKKNKRKNTIKKEKVFKQSQIQDHFSKTTMEEQGGIITLSYSPLYASYNWKNK